MPQCITSGVRYWMLTVRTWLYLLDILMYLTNVWTLQLYVYMHVYPTSCTISISVHVYRIILFDITINLEIIYLKDTWTCAFWDCVLLKDAIVCFYFTSSSCFYLIFQLNHVMHDTAIPKITLYNISLHALYIIIRMKEKIKKKLVNRIILAIVFVLSAGKSMP